MLMRLFVFLLITWGFCIRVAADEFDHDFEVDVICYRILEGNEVEVTREPWGIHQYTGDMVIPEIVTYEGMEYVVTTIGEFAFQGSDITSISLPATLKVIANRAFEDCSFLKEILLPEGLEEIGGFAFKGCGIRSVTIPSTVSCIGSTPFSQCGYLLKPEGVWIGAMGLDHVTVSEGNTFFDSREDCDAIIETATNKIIQGTNNSIITDGIEAIGDSAFFCCKRITKLYLPASLKEFGVRCFWNCQSMKTIYNFNPEPLEVKWPLFLLRSEWALDATLYIPIGTREAYENSYPWASFAEIVEFDPTHIDQHVAKPTGRVTYFNANGKRQSSLQRGLNIVLHADGTSTKKMVRR